MKKLIIISSIIICIVIAAACSKSNGGGGTGGGGTNTCTGTKSFTSDVNPIVQATCASSTDCHASGSTNGPGALTTYQQVFNNRSAIRTAVNNGTMPKNSSLTTTQKNNIICWIDAGAPNN